MTCHNPRMPSPTSTAHAEPDLDPPLADFVTAHARLFILTGAGCSTDSGIPDYRDVNGGWKRPQPVTFQAFIGELATRQRYWARSLVGWPRFGTARPNPTHHALARLEAAGQADPAADPERGPPAPGGRQYRR